MNDRIHRAGKNVIVSVAAQLLGWVFSFIVTLFLPRYVGSAGLGVMAIATSFISLFGVVASLGTSTVLVKEIARSRSRTAEMLSTALALRVPVTFLLGLIAWTLCSILGYPEIVRKLVFVFALGMIVSNVNDALGSILQGQENMKRQSGAALVERLLYAGGTILLIFLHATLPMLAAVGIFSGAISLCVNLTAFRDCRSDLHVPKVGAVLGLAHAGLPFVGWSVLRTLYGETDPIILSYVTSATVVGWYAAAARLVGALMFFPAALTIALLPTLSSLFAEGETQEFTSLSRRLVSLMLLIGIPAAVIMICLPKQMLSLLHYPSNFSGTIPVLRLAGLGAVLYFAAMGFGNVVIAADQQAKMLRSSIVATLIGIPACIIGSILTDRLWHNAAIGAMASDSLLEGMLIAAYLRAAPPGTFGKSTLMDLLRLVAAACPMAVLFLSPLGQRWGLWGIVPALACYIGGCIALRCIDAEYYEFARRLVSRRAARIL